MAGLHHQGEPRLSVREKSPAQGRDLFLAESSHPPPSSCLLTRWAQDS